VDRFGQRLVCDDDVGARPGEATVPAAVEAELRALGYGGGR